MPQHPAFAEGRAAVITGGASGIGLAAAKRFAAFGMKICLADLSQEALDRAAEQLSAARRQMPPPKSAAGATPACEAIRPQGRTFRQTSAKDLGSVIGETPEWALWPLPALACSRRAIGFSVADAPLPSRGRSMTGCWHRALPQASAPGCCRAYWCRSAPRWTPRPDVMPTIADSAHPRRRPRGRLFFLRRASQNRPSNRIE